MSQVYESFSEFRPAGWYDANKKKMQKTPAGKVIMDSDLDSNDENPFHEIIQSKRKESKRALMKKEQRLARLKKLKEGW